MQAESRGRARAPWDARALDDGAIDGGPRPRTTPGSRVRALTAPGRRPAPATREVQALRVLIVDDSPMQRFVMRTMLRKLGVAATDEARDGLEALARLSEARFDVVLLDCRMPGLDGYGTAAAIAARGDVAWVAGVSADDEAGDLARAREAGMHDYLVKPVDLRALAVALERALDAQRARS